MKIGLVGFADSGKTTVFGALTGLTVATGYAARRDKANVGVVKVPDARVDALTKLYQPKKKTYAEIVFTDLAAGSGPGIERAVLNAMRNLDALCQVVRAFPDAAGEAPDPLDELTGLETETILADLEVVEQRVERLRRDRSDARELALLDVDDTTTVVTSKNVTNGSRRSPEIEPTPAMRTMKYQAICWGKNSISVTDRTCQGNGTAIRLTVALATYRSCSAGVHVSSTTPRSLST